MFTLTVDL